ncbi:transposase [Aneurinibacillus terranovensis]|uniref:transposase n=1 Tax=Aneurinibacillus terranovensis TaxID=278991 RepID=UPI00040A4445|nr:transposase [Aneurinibacillus terranovensis]
MKKIEHDEEYKKQTVQYIKESGKAVAEISRELKINANTLYGWVKRYGSEPEIIAVQGPKSEDNRLKELQKQIRDLQEENDILKKAMHFFAKDRR